MAFKRAASLEVERQASCGAGANLEFRATQNTSFQSSSRVGKAQRSTLPRLSSTRIKASNVAITGAGTIVGRGGLAFDSWRDKQTEDQQQLRQLGARGVPVHERVLGKGHFLRPAMLQFFGCRVVLVEDVTLTDMPFWGVHPVYSASVTIRGVRVDSRYANSDGIDVDSSTDVLIERCTLKTGNDCVSIKSGRDEDGWRVGRASENIVVRAWTLPAHRPPSVPGSLSGARCRAVFGMCMCTTVVVIRSRLVSI